MDFLSLANYVTLTNNKTVIQKRTLAKAIKANFKTRTRIAGFS